MVVSPCCRGALRDYQTRGGAHTPIGAAQLLRLLRGPARHQIRSSSEAACQWTRVPSHPSGDCPHRTTALQPMADDPHSTPACRTTCHKAAATCSGGRGRVHVRSAQSRSARPDTHPIACQRTRMVTCCHCATRSTVNPRSELGVFDSLLLPVSAPEQQHDGDDQKGCDRGDHHEGNGGGVVWASS